MYKNRKGHFGRSQTPLKKYSDIFTTNWSSIWITVFFNWQSLIGLLLIVLRDCMIRQADNMTFIDLPTMDNTSWGEIEMTAIIPSSHQLRAELAGAFWQVTKWRRRKNPDGYSLVDISWHKITSRQTGESRVQRFISQDELEGFQQTIDTILASSFVIARAITQSPYNDSWLDVQVSSSNWGC
ncbi:MAG: hypothetical protein AB2731_10130 [Candidatus Thiodiazotropha sp.]